MRMTEKQLAVAKKLAIDSFNAGVGLNAQMPTLYLVEDANTHKLKIGDPVWSDIFKRDDITSENEETFNTIFYKTYQQEYESWFAQTNGDQNYGHREQQKYLDEVMKMAETWYPDFFQ